MKKIGKLLLMLILCFGFVGCSNNKNVANITEKFEEKNYNVSYNSGDEPTVSKIKRLNLLHISNYLMILKIMMIC